MMIEPEANCLKIIFLLMKYGSKVLQHRIEFELRVQKWQKVPDFLRERKHDILHLTLGKQKKCCIKDCKKQNATTFFKHKSLLELLYEDVKKSCSERFIHCCSCYFVPKTNLDIKVWDITLTSCLLLEVIGLEDAGQERVIQNLRNLRNSKELLHRGNAEMENDEFEKMWIKLSNDIKEVAEKCEPYFFSSVRDEVDKLKNDKLEQGEIYNAQECLKELKNEEDFIQCMVKLLTSSKSEVKRDIEVENIYDYSKCCLKEHKENSSMYVEPTKAIKHCLKTLENYRLIVVTGEAGSGKTRFGLELMSRMQNKHQNLTALILTKCNQWDILDLTKKYIFFIDDLLGKYITDDGIYHSWGTAFNPMLKLLNKGNVYFIFALRNYIWYLMKDKLSDYTLFRLSDSSNALVDLSGVEFGMTSQEKLRMLKKFCRHYDVHVCKALQEERRSFECPDDTSISLSEETLKSIANMDTTSGFPFLCEKFFTQKKSLKKSSYFFKDYSAQNFVKEQVDQLLYEKKYLQYVLLVFLFLKNKSFEVNGLLKVKKEIVGIGLVKCTEIMPATIRGCLKEMLNKFISSSDDVFNLKHKVVYEAVLLSFGENFPEKFLDLISKSVLFTYVRSWGYVLEKQEVIVQLDEDMTESLAKKLIDVYGSNKDEAYSDVYRHPSFQDKKLVDCFLDILEGEESFQVFLNSFLAGACKEKNDILATEVINRFFNSYEFESDILDLVLNNDLIHTFRQYMDHSGYIKLFSEFYAESSGESYAFDFFMKAVRYGARQCIMDMLNYFDTEDDLDTDYDIENMRYILADVCDHIPSLMEILSHHNPSCGYDWTDVLTKLAKLYPCLENRNNFYRNVILFSIISNKLDIALKILEMIESVSNKIVKWLVLGIFIWNKTGFLNTMCKILKDVHFQIDSVEAARLCISCVECNGNEKLLNEFLNAFTCNFQVGVDLKTILHVCEAQNFSDAILLNLIQRPEGKIMFSLVDDKGRTPVQCRAVYKKVRPVDVTSSNHHCVRDIDWRDDTLVMYSPIKKVHVIDVVWRDDILVARSVVKHCMYLGQNE